MSMTQQERAQQVDAATLKLEKAISIMELVEESLSDDGELRLRPALSAALQLAAEARQITGQLHH